MPSCCAAAIAIGAAVASATGRLAVRSGMYNIGMLLESHGMGDEEVTIAEVLSDQGYATAFHGKLTAAKSETLDFVVGWGKMAYICPFLTTAYNNFRYLRLARWL